MKIQTSMSEQNPGGLTTAGFPGLPGSPLDDCLVARLANELFKETPTAPPAGEQPLSAAYTAAPDVPVIGGHAGETILPLLSQVRSVHAWRTARLEIVGALATQ